MDFIVSAGQMQEIDRRTIRDFGIPGIVLMERAGIAVTEIILQLPGVNAGSRVAVLCGVGNNGGDGYVIARELCRKNVAVDVFILTKEEKLFGDALKNYELVKKMPVQIKFIHGKEDLPDNLSGYDAAVDALLGTGAKGDVRGLFVPAIGLLNSSPVPVVSVDIPSGIGADTGQINGCAVEASATVTMGLAKPGLYLYPGREYSGEVFIADIGFPDSSLDASVRKMYKLSEADVASLLPRRIPDGHKGTFGKVLLVAGSPGMTGAAYLAGQSALLAGAGLVVAAVPTSLNAILENKFTEVMTLPVPETNEHTLGICSYDAIIKQAEWADVIIIGPGLGRSSETGKLIKKVLKNCPRPVVLDADGLYPFSSRPELLKERKSKLIITPHIGEFARLFGVETEEIKKNSIDSLQNAVNLSEAVVILKEATTMIGGYAGEVIFNLTGNAGMASGGAGDVLTGIIAALYSGKLTAFASAACGVFIHGMAGDHAARKKGMTSMTAGDILTSLSAVFRKIER